MILRTFASITLMTLTSTAFAGGHMHQSPLLRRNFRCPPINPKNPRNPHVQLFESTPDRADCYIRRIQRGWTN